MLNQVLIFICSRSVFIPLTVEVEFITIETLERVLSRHYLQFILPFSLIFLEKETVNSKTSVCTNR